MSDGTMDRNKVARGWHFALSGLERFGVVIAFVALFGCEPLSAEEDAEPAAARLRRRLLPLQGRLRWSILANGWVVAGR